MFSRIRHQLTLLYTVLTALALGSFALLFYYGLSSQLMQEQEHELEANAVRASREVRDLLKRAARPGREGEREKPAEFAIETVYVMFALAPDGTVIAPRNQDPAIQPPHELLPKPSEVKRPVVYKTERGGESARFLWMTMPIHEDDRYRGSLLVGRDLSAHDRFLKSLSQALWLSVVLFLLLAGLIGYFSAGRALVPIRKSFEAQRRFAADASHELRTPLSVIQASLDVVEKEDGERLSPLSRQIVADLKDEVRRMARLTGNLLTLARADSGGLELNIERFDVGEAAAHVYRAMHALAAARGVELELSARRNLFLRADKDRIIQLMMILVDNGIKFTPTDGRVKIRVEQEKECSILLEVSDTGVGLSLEERKHVFERFYRVDKSRSREEGGAGLGLAIAAWIAEVHGAKISVHAEKEGGSLFRVVFPKT